MRCEKCGSTDDIQVHHFSDDPRDVMMVCKDCHISIHNRGTGPARGELDWKKVEKIRKGAYIRQGRIYSSVEEAEEDGILGGA